MARIISQRDIVKNSAESFNERSTEFYSRWLEGSPTYVTYYKRNNLHSTSDQHLEDVKEVVGSESPIMFDKIEDFVLYGFQESNPGNSIEEYGLDWELESEATIIPNTIVPNVDDFFSVHYNNEENLFRIIEVDIDRINGDSFYKVSYSWASEEMNEIEKQLQEEYLFSYENIGTEDQVVIPKKNYMEALKIDDWIKELSDFYLETHLSKKTNILYGLHNGYRIYNRYLIKFIKENSVFTRRYNLYSSVSIEDSMGDIGYYQNPIYRKTLYYAIEKRDAQYFTMENFNKVLICHNDYNSAFFHDYNDYHECVYIDCNKHGEGIIRPHKSLLSTKIKLNEKYCSEEDQEGDRYYMENLIIDYINKEDIGTASLEGFMNGFNYEISTRVFLLLPIIIFIMKTYRNELINNKGDVKKLLV